MSGVVKAVVGIAFAIVGGLLIAATGGAAAAVLLAQGGQWLFAAGLLEEASKLFLPSAPKTRNRADVEYTGTVEPRRIIYGEMRVSGLNTIRPLVTGSSGKYLHQILTICGHECEAIDHVYFNETDIADAAITAIAGNDSDGLVTTGNFADVAWIRRYLGTQTVVDFKLNAESPAFWTSAHVGNGVTYIALTYKLSEKRYASGKPDITCLVQGKKCYDPRLDATPGAAPTNPTFSAYTQNPALQLADYLMDANLGRGIDAAKIDWALVVAAANICEETVSLPSASSQSRYTSSMILEASGSADIHRTNIAALASAMMGVCYRQGGKWLMYAGAALTPSFDLTNRDIVGDVSVRLETPMGEKYNFVRGTFSDSTRNYQQVEFEPRSNLAYEEDDGVRLPKVVSFANVTTPYEAQRNALIVLRRSRMKRTLSAKFGLSAFALRPFQVGTMTFADIGWDEQRVVVTSWQFAGDGSIDVTLQEDDSTIWSDPTTDSYTVPGSGTSGTAAAYVPDPPSGLVITPLVGGLTFSWNAPLAMLSGDVIELWESDTSNPFAGEKIWEGKGTSVSFGRTDETTRYYALRVRAENDNYSSTEPASGGVTGAAVDDGTFVIHDQFFQKSTTRGDFWDWSDQAGGTPTGITLSLTGGVVGGKCAITGTTANKYVYAIRQPPMKVITGAKFSMAVRFRRTGSLTGTGGNTALDYGGVTGTTLTSVFSGTSTSMSTTGSPVTITAMNAFTVNQWQEVRAELTVTNLPKNQTQNPYGFFYFYMSSGVTGGTVEIDSVSVNPI
jgi:hypothetical protein